MENPIKKKSLIPRMFRAFTVYFFITLAVFFGYVQLFGGVKTIRGKLPESAVGEIDMSFSNFVSNMMSLENIYVEGVDLKFVGGGSSISMTADFAMDMATNNVSVDAVLDVDGHVYDVGVVYCNPELFISIDEKTYKFAVTSVGGDLDFSGILKVLSQISKDFGLGEKLNKIQETLGIDFSSLSMQTLMDQLDISTKKTNGEVNISIMVMDHLEATIICDENCFMKSASIKGINIGANSLVMNVPTVEMNSVNILDRIDVPSEENVIDMTGVNDYVVYAQNLFAEDYVEMNLTVDVSGKTYEAKALIDQTQGIGFKIETDVEGYHVQLVYANDIVYLKANDFGVSFAVADMNIWKDRIFSIIEEKTSKTIEELLQEILSKYIDVENGGNALQKIKDELMKFLSCSENLNQVLPSEVFNFEDKLVLTWDAGLEIKLANEAGVLSEIIGQYKDVVVSANFKNVEQGIEIPEGCEDLSPVLAKLENLLDYVENGIFEFDFNAEYNGLNFTGKFKYANGVFEISDMLVAGEVVNIRIEGGFVYFSYGNMKLKFAVPKNDGSFESAKIKDMISKLTSDTLGVEINFGVFEELLNMISSYTVEDWKTKLVLKVSGNQDDIHLSVSNKNDLSLSEILTANVTFVDNKIDTAKVSLYDILTAQIKVDYVEQSTIKPFVADDYKDYSEDFLAGALDSLEVVSNVYGFSSDIAIRYSKSTFYGELVAMMVRDDTSPLAIDGFIPAVSLHTTSLGLNSYIYIVGNTLYIDINGLQVSADMNKTTIDEIIAFVENKFGVALGGQGDALVKTTEAFKVILPAIDKIYGSWVTANHNGLQININDALWYGQNSRFEDIVLQACIANYNNTIVPTKLVVGANIIDPNTLLYDDYSDAWLSSGLDGNGNKIVLEDEITKNLNFGAYFTNLSVGVMAESIDRVFNVVDKNYSNVTSVVSNYGVTNLSDFNSYETIMDLTETVYDYAMGMNYQVSINATVVDEKSTLVVGGDVVVAVADLAEGQSAALDLFGGKSLKVQGNLDINSNGTQHLIDLLYSNVDEGMYFTYSHGDSIAKGNKFRAKIANSNMSEIISMIVKFAKLDLSDGIKEAWNIGYCMTDFSYVQSLLGLEKVEIDDPISKADVALNSIESITKLIGLINLDKTIAEDGLANITLSVELKLGETPALATILLREEMLNGVAVFKLRQISVSNLIFGGKTVNATIDVKDFSEASFNYDTTAAHIDFSDITEIVDSAVNTMNQKEISYQGNLLVDLGSFGKIELANLHLYVKLPDQIKNEKFYLLAEYDIEADSIATIMIEGKDNKKRSAIVEYKDGRISVVERYEKAFVSGTQYKTASFALNELSNVENLKKFVYTALGLNGTGKGIIDMVLNNITFPTPTIEELITGFTSNMGEYGLELDGKHLTGMDDSDTFKIKLKDSRKYEVEVGNLEMLKDRGLTDENGNYLPFTSVIKFLNSISCDANDMPLKASIATISFNLNASNDKYSFLEYVADSLNLGGVTYPSNEVFRENYLNSVRNPWGWKPISYHTISFETGSENLKVSNIESFYGDRVTLPQLLLKQETLGDVTTNYSFDGWFTEKGVEVGDVLTLTADIKLFARWKFKNKEVTKSLKVYDSQDQTKLLFEKRIKTGDTISLDDWIERKADWVYVDENGQKIDILGGMAMPESDIVVFKKDKHILTINYNEFVGGTITSKQTQVSLYQGENFLGAIPTNGNANSGFYMNLNGDEIDFANFKFVTDKTGWFVDSNYTFSLSDYVMKNCDMEVFAVDKQNVVVKSEYGNVGQWTFEGFPNEKINLPTQTSYYEDDGTQTKRVIYTFKGWSEEISVIPMVGTTIHAVWEIETKYYYTVNFDVRQYRVFGMVAGAKWKTSPSFVPASIRVLEGETVNLDNTSYQPTAKAHLTAIAIDPKNFKVTSWGLSAWGDLTKGGSGFTSYTVSKDHATNGVITLHGCWQQV